MLRSQQIPLLVAGFSSLLLLAGCGSSDEPVSASTPKSTEAGAKVNPDDRAPEEALPDAAAATSDRPAIREISEEALIYGLPLVMNYSVMNEYFINESSGQYKCGFNEVFNTARVYTPEDTAVVTPNSDTPYSFFCADLRAEPVVFSVPEIEEQRYYSIQLVDMYTFNYGYVGSRATGNGAGAFMIAGPGWKGETPAGVRQVFQCETEFTTGIFRTQLFNPADIENVRKIQDGYALQTLSAFLKQPAPPAAPAIDWPKIDRASALSSPFSYLNFLLQFCPATGPAAAEKPLRSRFASIGIEAGKPYSATGLTDAQQAESAAGIKAGYEKVGKRVATIGSEVNGWLVGAAFGDRGFFDGDWLLRAAAARAGIYGNNAEEATYPLAKSDADGQPLDGSQHNYTLTFPAEAYPPVNAFWSVTMYDGRTQLLIKNPIGRYLINSPMLPEMQKNDDGSLTLYIQKDSPGKERESNWLPAPDGPIYLVMRLYWPKEGGVSVLPPGKGTWKPPVIQPVPVDR